MPHVAIAVLAVLFAASHGAPDDAVDILRELIAIRTYNNPAQGFPGNEEELCRRVAGWFDGTPVEARLFPSAEGRANLLLRYRGDGSRLPVLLMAHVDTVDVQRENWESDPLAAFIGEDGYLYGRGAIDDKGMAACLIAAMRRLARERPRLSRDVLVLLTADEEAGGAAGIKFMLEHHRDEIRAEFALNEGGHILMDEEGRVRSVQIQCAEKSMHNVRLIATGRSGHSSVPHGDNPIEKLAQAVARIAAYRAPARVTEAAAGYFRGMAALTQDPDLRAAMLAVAAGEGDIQAAAGRLSAANEFWNAVLRDTATTTIFRAGIRFNVIPSSAEATLNVRLLPGRRLEDFLEDLAAVIGRDDVRLIPEVPPEEREPEAPASPAGGELYGVLERVAREFWPDAVVMPMMSTGATDSRDLRAAGIPAYGLLPMPLREEDLRRMHADNERVPVESMRVGADFQYRVILEAAR